MPTRKTADASTPEGETPAGRQVPARADRERRSQGFVSQKLGSITTYRWLDVLNEAYHSGLVGFMHVSVEPFETIKRDGSPQTTYLAHATALFRDEHGEETTHMGSGEANYENCNANIGVSAARMAETRAKGRALAHALNLDANFDYEMADPANPEASAIKPSSGYSRPSAVPAQASRVPTADPSKYPPENGALGGWECEVCGEELTDSEKYTAGQKASWSVRDFGQVLCWNHSQEAKKAKAA